MKSRYFWFWALGIFLFLGAIAGYFFRDAMFPTLSQHENLFISLLTPVNGGIILFTMWMVHRLFNVLIPIPRGFSKPRIGLRILLQMLIGVAIMQLFRYLLLEVLARSLVQALPREKIFEIITHALYFILSLLINLGFFADQFFRRWRESIQFAERLEREKTQVQYDNLKNQLNPHLLFNAMSSLNSLIFEDQKLASNFLQHLSKVYRYLLQHNSRESLPLKTELDFLDNYLSLVKIRFGEAIQIRMDIPPAMLEKEIVPVTLQTLVENALKHNVININKPLQISIRADETYVWVSNNLQRKNLVEGSNRQGLENLGKLYHYLSPHPLQIKESETEFKVGLPLL